jgi:hypothetical protein
LPTEVTAAVMIATKAAPHAPGLYVAYVDSDFGELLTERILLTWDSKQWHYPMSDTRYRGHVYGWIGPLPIMRLEP